MLKSEYPSIPFYNHLIKGFLVKRFDNQISFCSPYRKNDSKVVYSSSIDPSMMVSKLQVFNEARSTGLLLRQKLRAMSFGLEDSFCDSNDLANSIRDTRMPESVVEFMPAFLNIRKADFVKFHNSLTTEGVSSSDDEEDENNDCHSRSELKANVPKKIRY